MLITFLDKPQFSSAHTKFIGSRGTHFLLSVDKSFGHNSMLVAYSSAQWCVLFRLDVQKMSHTGAYINHNEWYEISSFSLCPRTKKGGRVTYSRTSATHFFRIQYDFAMPKTRKSWFSYISGFQDNSATYFARFLTCLLNKNIAQ